MASARVSKDSIDDDSSQEKDLLDRSKKKSKVTRQEVLDAIHTTIGLSLERKTISYKDICIGVNGHNTSEEDALFFQDNNMDGGNQGQEQDPRHEQGFLGDPLCPIILFA
ncbi:hypothetical protein SESBI_29527 [Sesbania bispinosa]|nr:hypothetical protein SESBI_29527 [Sesbania bispinosa]